MNVSCFSVEDSSVRGCHTVSINDIKIYDMVLLDNYFTLVVDGDNIRVEGYVGTWYVIDEASYKGEILYLLEHNEYGDEAPHLVIDGKQHVYLDDSYNGWLDMEEAYDDFINPESY